MKPIAFITGNENKLKQVQFYLKYPIVHKALDLVEIQSLDPHEIVEAKVREAYRIIKKPVLVEDVSLTFTALGKLPGPLIKWFLEAIGTEGLCTILNGYKTRKAFASVLYGFYDGKKIEYYEGKCEGTIAKHPKGTYSFGWNPIFIANGEKKTWGELTLDEQEKTSIRKIALSKLDSYLHAL